jgi:PAS domain S-box-containing protein
MNVDPNETFAFAVIDSSGDAWLLDETLAGRPFDITSRPYFPSIASAEIGRIAYGPRTTNANTGSDTLPVFLKTRHGGQSITVSTAISATRIDTVLRDLTRSDQFSTSIVRNDEAVFSSGHASHPPPVGPRYEKWLAGRTESDVRDVFVQDKLDSVDCAQTIPHLPFVTIARVDKISVLDHWFLYLIGVATLTVITGGLAVWSTRTIGKLLSELEHEHSALQKNERLLSATFHHAGVGIANIGLDGKFLMVNERFSKIVDHEPSSLLSMSFDDITHPEDRAASHEGVRDLLNGVRRTYVAEKRYIGSHGDIVWTQLTGALLTKEDGSPDYFISVIEDISDRRRAQESLRLALVDAERANQAKSEFLATISHEFRTPLNAISGFSEMLACRYFGDLGSPKYEEYAHNIWSSSQHLLQLVNATLDLSSAEAGNPALTIEPVDIAEIVDDCVRSLTVEFERGGITTSVSVQPDRPPLHADAGAIRQILLNLLSNAVKATPPGGSISVRVEANSDKHVLVVSDTGMGVPEHLVDRMTDPFTVIGGNAYHSRDGKGLGLAIVKSLVQRHRGDLRIESRTASVLVAIEPDRGALAPRPDLSMPEAGWQRWTASDDLGRHGPGRIVAGRVKQGQTLVHERQSIVDDHQGRVVAEPHRDVGATVMPDDARLQDRQPITLADAFAHHRLGHHREHMIDAPALDGDRPAEQRQKRNQRAAQRRAAMMLGHPDPARESDHPPHRVKPLVRTGAFNAQMIVGPVKV